MLLDWHSPLKGISAKRKTSDQSTPRMPIRCLAASPGAITLNVLIIATVVVPPFRLLQMPPLHPHSTTRSSPISPCPISESRLPQTYLTKPSPKGNSQWPEHHFGPLFAAYLRERSRKDENGLISFTYDHDYDRASPIDQHTRIESHIRTTGHESVPVWPSTRQRGPTKSDCRRIQR